jgi:hypothetical protein
LLLAGFAHAVVAIPDALVSGAFSAASKDTTQALKATSLNITDWLHGENTSVFESAWGAYTGFAIAVGLLIGFLGLILLLVLKHESAFDNQYRSLLLAYITMSAIITVISILFFFWFPAVLLGASLICFILARFDTNQGDSHVAR